MCKNPTDLLERAAGIEPVSQAWKAWVITIIRCPHYLSVKTNISPKSTSAKLRLLATQQASIISQICQKGHKKPCERIARKEKIWKIELKFQVTGTYWDM